MSKKSKKNGNLNKAIYEMFGVGKEPQDDQSIEVVAEKADVAYETEKKSIASETTDIPKVETIDVPAVEEMQTTHIAEGTVIEGNLKSNGNLELAGEFQGDIDVKGSAIIESVVTGNITADSVKLVGSKYTGNINVVKDFVADNVSIVEGDITAEEAVISGRIVGELNVRKNITLESSAVIEGNIKTGTMVMACGAVVKGKIEMAGV